MLALSMWPQFFIGTSHWERVLLLSWKTVISTKGDLPFISHISFTICNEACVICSYGTITRLASWNYMYTYTQKYKETKSICWCVCVCVFLTSDSLFFLLLGNRIKLWQKTLSNKRHLRFFFTVLNVQSNVLDFIS